MAVTVQVSFTSVVWLQINARATSTEAPGASMESPSNVDEIAEPPPTLTETDSVPVFVMVKEPTGCGQSVTLTE